MGEYCCLPTTCEAVRSRKSSSELGSPRMGAFCHRACAYQLILSWLSQFVELSAGEHLLDYFRLVGRPCIFRPISSMR
jgi:hypothetical protein